MVGLVHTGNISTERLMKVIKNSLYSQVLAEGGRHMQKA